MKTFVVPETEIQVLEFNELEPSVQDRVYSKWLADGGGEYPWFDEEKTSLDAVLKLLGYSVNDWSVGTYSRSYVRLSDNCSHWEDKAWEEHWVEPVNKKLGRWLLVNVLPEFYRRKTYYLRYSGTKRADKKRVSRIIYTESCNLTGYGTDEMLYQELKEWVTALYAHDEKNSVLDIADVANEVCEKWLKSVVGSITYYESREAMIDSFDGNYVVFDASGKQVDINGLIEKRL